MSVVKDVDLKAMPTSIFLNDDDDDDDDDDNLVCLRTTWDLPAALRCPGSEQAAQPNQNRALRVVSEKYVDTETNIHLYSPERQQQQVKKAPNTQQQKQTNKREKTTLKSGVLVNSVTRFIYQRTLKTSVNQR